jgi:hypothetical protein
MIYMMEKYTDNLEELVVERTELLSDEKKRTDALLERMLPTYVPCIFVFHVCAIICSRT